MRQEAGCRDRRCFVLMPSFVRKLFFGMGLRLFLASGMCLQRVESSIYPKRAGWNALGDAVCTVSAAVVIGGVTVWRRDCLAV